MEGQQTERYDERKRLGALTSPSISLRLSNGLSLRLGDKAGLQDI
jgi:hypothetical protein